ncbi:MAG: hypothetical protein IJ429_02145 [Lachnospiraceae bacterium]|nr:hypothetical protein [Lachnospiraceae bacterium]
MKNGQVKITGIVPNEKNGKKSFTIYGITPLEPYEAERGGTGMKVVQEWTNRIDCSMLKPDDIVEFSYSKGFQNTAVLSNITVVAPAK